MAELLQRGPLRGKPGSLRQDSGIFSLRHVTVTGHPGQRHIQPHTFFYTLDNFFFRQGKSSDLHSLPYAAAEMHRIFSGYHQICRLGFVIADHTAFGNRNGQLLCFTGCQQYSLFKADQFLGRLFKSPLRLGKIQLYNLFTGHISGIGNRNSYFQFTVVICAGSAFSFKGRIGHTVAKGVSAPVRIGEGFKIAVAHIDVLFVDRIQPHRPVVRNNSFLSARAVIEVSGGRNTVIARRPCERKLRGGIDSARQHIHQCAAGKHTAQATVYHCVHLIGFRKADADGVAHIQDHDQLFKVLTEGLQQ